MSNDATGIDVLPMANPSSDELSEREFPGSLADIAVRLKSMRDMSGFSQRELAKRAGVTNSSISMIEQGQVSPSIQSLTRILAAFPIGLADFFSFKLLPFYTHSHAAEHLFNQSVTKAHQLDARIEHLSAGHSNAFSALMVDSCGVVLKGNVQLTRISGSQMLGQGDSFYIPANQLFRLSSPSGQDASLFRCSIFVHMG